jgi:uncharacterized membrane protein
MKLLQFFLTTILVLSWLLITAILCLCLIGGLLLMLIDKHQDWFKIPIEIIKNSTK